MAPEELDKLNERWNTLTTKVQESTTTTGKIISDITTHNTGEAADAFTSQMNTSGIPTRLTTFQQHTNTIEQAHTTASSILHDTTTQMQAKAAELNTNLRRALTTPNLQTPITLFTLLKKAQQDLHAIDTKNAQAITNAYQTTERKIATPARILRNEKGEDYDPKKINSPFINDDVEHYWESDSLSIEERKSILQKIVDEEFKSYDMKPVKITWDSSLDSNAKAYPQTYGTWVEGLPFLSGKLLIDPDFLNDPEILLTTVHEVRHAAQHQAVSELHSAQISPVPNLGLPIAPDLSLLDKSFKEKYNSSVEEVSSWDRNFKNYASFPENGSPEDFEKYKNQPVEVDAREREEEFGRNELTLDLIEKYKNGNGSSSSSNIKSPLTHASRQSKMIMEFSPSSWEQGAQQLSSELDTFVAAAKQVFEATVTGGSSNSATDAALAAALAKVNSVTSSTVDEITTTGRDHARMMQETADDYRAVEEHAVEIASQLKELIV